MARVANPTVLVGFMSWVCAVVPFGYASRIIEGTCGDKLGRETCDFAAQNGDGSFGERERGLCRGVDGRNHRRQAWIGVSGGVRSVPDVLFAAKCDHANCAGKVPGPAAAFKGDSNGMRRLSIFIDEQQGPLAVWPPNGIARDKSIPGGVFDSDIGGIEVMGSAAMRHPLVIDHAAGVVESGIANELLIAIPKGVAPDGPALAAMLDAAGFDGRMNVKRAALGEEAADIVGKPQGRKNVGHVARQRTGKIAFGVHEGN